MNKIKDILYYCGKYTDKNHLINVLDNLTNMERNIVFNKLYIGHEYYHDRTLLQNIYTHYSNGKETTIDLLKKYKDNININIKNLDGNTLLYYVTRDKDVETLKLTYELYKDINVNILNNHGNNILHNGILMHGNEEIIKLLLEKGIRIQYKLLEYLIGLYSDDRINSKEFINRIMNILLEYLHTNDIYDYVLEELYKYIIKNIKINEDNREFYEKIFTIKSNTKSAAKVLALA